MLMKLVNSHLLNSKCRALVSQPTSNLLIHIVNSQCRALVSEATSNTLAVWCSIGTYLLRATIEMRTGGDCQIFIDLSANLPPPCGISPN